MLAPMLLPLLACTAAPVALDPAGEADADDVVEALPGAGESPAEDDPSAAVFDPTVVHDVALTMHPDAWADVSGNPWAYAWHEATLTVDGEEVGEVGVRAFGYGSLVAGKPSLKVSIDHVVPGQEWRGLEQLKLDNSSQDVGFLNELVSTDVMRAYGVPASRTGWARVSVNGDAVGFFVLLEAIDDRFLERWFGTDAGTLWGTRQGRWGQGVNPTTTPLEFYEEQTGSGSDGAELIALGELVASGSDADLAARVDLDGFLKETVGRAVLGSVDCFACDGNNFYLYDDGERWRIVPWDFDVELGAWYMSTALSVDPAQPWASSPWAYNALTGAPYTEPLLTRRLAAGADLDAEVAALLDGPADYDRLAALVADAAALIRADVDADPLGDAAAFDQRAADLRLFLHSRLSALLGRDASACDAFPDGVLGLADLAPTGTVGWGELLLDRTYWGPGFQVAGEHACRGAFAHAPSTVTVQVPEGYGVLQGAVGLQDWNQRCGDGASFRVEQGGATLWASGVRANYDAPLDMGAIAVRPGALTLTTDPGAEYSCDTTVWADVTLSPQ